VPQKGKFLGAGYSSSGTAQFAVAGVSKIKDGVTTGKPSNHPTAQQNLAKTAGFAKNIATKKCSAVWHHMAEHFFVKN
jgi:hypothetical protein